MDEVLKIALAEPMRPLLATRRTTRAARGVGCPDTLGRCAPSQPSSSPASLQVESFRRATSPSWRWSDAQTSGNRASSTRSSSGESRVRAASRGPLDLLNLYRVSTSGPKGRAFLIADLPGYGYARGGAPTQQEFGQLTGGFFAKLSPEASGGDHTRPRLAGVIHVVDIRHPALESDVSARAWVAHHGYRLVTIATKSDRIARSRREAARRRHCAALDGPVLLLSTRTGEGIGKVWAEISELL